MRKALVKMHEEIAGVLIERADHSFEFHYDDGYIGPPISLTMPRTEKSYNYDHFPPFFDGLLPEGIQLEGLLKKYKIDKTDYFSQLIITGSDLVGAVTVSIIENE